MNSFHGPDVRNRIILHALRRELQIVQRLPRPRHGPRVQRQKSLPDVLSVQEVWRLIGAVRRDYLRAYLWTVYSCGLRLNEGLQLQVGDIDKDCMLIHVHRGNRYP